MKYSFIKQKSIIVFGASIAGEKFYNLTKFFNLNVEYFVDNDYTKYDSIFLNKQVKNPNILRSIDKNKCFIVIASMYIREIRRQLEELGFTHCENFANMYEFNKMLVDNNKYLLKKSIEKNILKENLGCKGINFIFGLERGFVLGGAEIWAESISDNLNEKFNNSYLLDLKPQNTTSEKKNSLKFKNKLIQSEINLNNYVEDLIVLCRKLVSLAPLSIIPNYSQELALSAYIVKTLYPSLFNNIYILQGDTYIFFEQARIYHSAFKKFICASDEIKNRLVEILIDRQQDIETKISPVEVTSFKKQYSDKNKPINLGFASRLVKQAKRCDLILNLIKELEYLQVNYIFNIAGDGEYYNIINNFIKDNNLTNKVKLYGVIKHNKMNDFWRKQDLFLSLSDYEGTSISMLEALANGVVPIVTNVSGVKKFVKNNYNGYIVDIEDVKSISRYVKHLDNNRFKIKIYGENCINIIRKNCDIEKYVNFFNSIISN